MQKQTIEILNNLGFDEDFIKKIEQESGAVGTVSRKVTSLLRETGIPVTALKQIKDIERAVKTPQNKKRTNKQLIEELLDVCGEGLNEIAGTGVVGILIFENKKWKFEIDTQVPNKQVLKLCNSYNKTFTRLAASGMNVILEFGFRKKNNKKYWILKTPSQDDLPD